MLELVKVMLIMIIMIIIVSMIIVMMKIIFFFCRDYEGGHGTHVVGSILGNSMPTSFPGFDNGADVPCTRYGLIPHSTCASGTKRYNGMAPMAKIAFFDIENEANGFVP